MYCTKCGSENHADRKFCRNCGNAINGSTKGKKTKTELISQGNLSPTATKTVKNKKIKKKTTVIISILLVMVAIITGTLYMLGKDPKFEGGEYLDNLSEFYNITQTDELSDAAKSFARNIEYEVISTEKTGFKTGKATVEVKAPDFAKIIQNAVQKVMNESVKSDNRDELRNQAISEVVAEMKTGEFETLTKNIDMDIIRDGIKWKLVPNDEWYAAISGTMLTLYSQSFAKLFEEAPTTNEEN